MKLRTLVFWPHLIAGVLAGTVILLMCVTGVLLTYERQMVAWADSQFRSIPPPPDAARWPVEQLLERFTHERPGLTPTGITIASAAGAPVVVTVSQRTLYVDAYSGAILGEGSQALRRFMSAVRAWHRWLAVEGEGRPVARAITGWSNLLFLFIVASGFYLWFPRIWRWQHVKPVLMFNGTLRGKARDFNWHNVIGSWCALVLFIVVLGAVPISFPWANALVYRSVGEEPPAPGGARVAAPRPGDPASRGARDTGPRSADSEQTRGRDQEQPNAFSGLNALWERAERHVPGWRTINLRVPASVEGPIVFTIDTGNGGQPQLRSTLTLGRATGAVVSYEAFADQSLGRRIRSVLRFAHTGEVLGVGGQTVAGIASAGGAVLVWTGLALAWRRLRAWQKRRASRPVPQAALSATDAARSQPASL